MKKAGFVFLTLIFLMNFMPIHTFAALDDTGLDNAKKEASMLEPDDISSETAVLIDADTGQVLFDKNMNRRMYPASTTKIMTGMLTLEHLQPSDTVTATETALDGVYGSHMALNYDEVLTVDEAMYGLMLPSANDAANVLAENVSGTLDAFANLMNRRAQEIGAVNTHFSNAHGLHEDDHYTTAYDMALITRQAIQTPNFLQYFGTARHTIPPTNMQERERPLTNQQFMLLPDQWVYSPEVIGGKVGYTTEARHTMSTAASKNGRTLICVVFSTTTDEKFYDTQLLLDFGFNEFVQYDLPSHDVADKIIPLVEDGTQTGEVTFYMEESVPIWLHKSVSPEMLKIEFDIPDECTSQDDINGSVSVNLTGQSSPGIPTSLLTVDLSAEISIPDVPVWSNMENSGTSFFFNVRDHIFVPMAFLLGGIALLITAVVIFSTYKQRQKIKARKARLERRMREIKER